MKRNIDVMLGDGSRLARCATDLQGRRESAAFEYGAGWLGAPARFALGPTLPLQAGPQFHRKSKDGSIFHAAIADTEPDGWAKRIIMRDHIKRRQELRREGKEEAQPLNALDYYWLWMISAVSARFVFATKRACCSARRKKGAGPLRHSSSLDIC